MIKNLKIVGSAYELAIPQYCFPNYKQHEVVRNFHDKDWFNVKDEKLGDLFSAYTFEYFFQVKSNKRIYFISAPEGSQKTETGEGFLISCKPTNKPPKRDLRIFYKAEDMMYP